MTDTLEEPIEPLILKRKKKLPRNTTAARGKVAYADFVTAMMAFFLLLWLLNVTTEEQKRGISDFFEPIGVSEEDTGLGATLKGLSVEGEGALRSAGSPPTVMIPVPSFGAETEEADPGRKTAEEAEETKPDLSKVQNYEEEEDLLNRAKEAIQQSLQTAPELMELQKNLVIDVVPEGLRIQILDTHEEGMFEADAAELTPQRQAPDRAGRQHHRHPAPRGADRRTYRTSDWSRDRTTASGSCRAIAASTRRWLADAGLPDDRITTVIGKADTEPLLRAIPPSPRNRRISIILVRETPVPDGRPAKMDGLRRRNGGRRGTTARHQDEEDQGRRPPRRRLEGGLCRLRHRDDGLLSVVVAVERHDGRTEGRHFQLFRADRRG